MNSYDVVVLGAGPAGQKAAICAQKSGARALLVDEEQLPGGACVRHGTIPSKTLRETALALTAFRRLSGGVVQVALDSEVSLQSLMSRLDEVIHAHESFIDEQLRRNQVERWHGRARFVSPHQIEVRGVDGIQRRAEGRFVVIATGSRPRNPPEVQVDHEHVLDSDSILSMTYLPKSLAVLGGGVIACEYASIFASLGVEVTVVDRGPRPLGFLDPELTDCFTRALEATGGRFLGGFRPTSVVFDGLSSVTTTLENGATIETEKVLCALGRVANIEALELATAGLLANARGLIEVDDRCRTRVPHIYAAGDVIGPPSLASTSMEQGRRAVCDALGLHATDSATLIPAGVYTIPEISSVGLDEPEAKKRGGAVVGRARFSELARAQIAAAPEGLLKLVADAAGRKIIGVQVVGAGAAELVHIGQLAILSGWEVDQLVEQIFNFPTLAEAYRVAALDVIKQRMRVVVAATG